jgi:type IV pilus assembly protein PilN
MVIAGFNLAAADYRQKRRTLVQLAVASGVLALLLAGQAYVWVAQRRENQAVEARVAAMEARLRQHQSQAQAVRTTLPVEALKRHEVRVAAYNQMLEASAFSWIGLLVELERAVPSGVTVTAIQPDLASGKVSLQGEARSFEELTKLLRGLEQRTSFRDVFLLRQAKRKAAGAASEGWEFSVSLRYAGRTR